ncbi:concanavalin A-like lectin/glucanase [Lichtheimia hyalospora FSU 10163]|nr:concanavalin A-like lectin/glucanase [Lichtheimia hyalospora FSU 10163]
MRSVVALSLATAVGILSSLSTVHVAASSSSDAVVCDCGFQDENGRIWSEIWHSDYNSYKANLHKDKHYVVMNYTVPPKYSNTLERLFDPANVQLASHDDQSSYSGLQLAVRKQDDGQFTSASFGTKREDFLYGTFRASMKTSPVPGTVQAFFFFRDNTCEIDVEAVSRIQNPWKTYFTVQPQIFGEEGVASNLTNTKYTNDFDPTTDFHEYRFDWMPDDVTFYLDGSESSRLTHNVPQLPGRVLINHWTDGNPEFSGLPDQDSFLHIANMTVFFNSSEATGPPVCQKRQTPCSVADIMSQKLLPASNGSGTSSRDNNHESAAAASTHLSIVLLYTSILYILSSIIMA